MNRQCANCGKVTPEKEQMYSIRIDMFARAEPLVFSEAELRADHESQLKELVEFMEICDAEEACDQVYESYTFDICARCRKRLHRGLKRKATGQTGDVS